MEWLARTVPGFGIAAAIAIVFTIAVYVVYYRFAGVSLDRGPLLGIWTVFAAAIWIVGFSCGWWPAKSKGE
jgi:hypothetical protein